MNTTPLKDESQQSGDPAGLMNTPNARPPERNTEADSAQGPCDGPAPSFDPVAHGQAIIAAAERYRAAGLSPVLLYGLDTDGQCTCQKGKDCGKSAGKHPFGQGWQSKNPSWDDHDDFLARTGSYNIGIRAGGPERVTILDVDGKPGRESIGALIDRLGPLPDTLAQRTGGGGSQLFFSWPADVPMPRNSVSKLGAHIDIRSEGGQGAVEPSRHRSGGVYQWIEWGMSIAELPRAWADEILAGAKASAKAGAGTARPATPAETDETPARPEHFAEAVTDALAWPVLPGRGLGQAFKVALHAHRLDCNTDQVEQVLQVFNGRRPVEDQHTEAELHHDAEGAARSAEHEKGRTVIVREACAEVAETWFKKHEGAANAPERSLPQASWDSTRSDSVGSDAEPDEWPPAHSPRSDLSNARRIVHKYRSDIRYFVECLAWLAWDGKRWADDTSYEIERRAKTALEELWEEAKGETDDEKRKAAFAWAVQCQNRNRIENAIALAKSEPGIPVTAEMLDRDPWLFNCANGTLNLRTGALKPHDRADLITKLAPVDYDPAACSALWEQCLVQWTGGNVDLASYLQRATGYAMFGEWREKKFWFGYGNPDGGKSTFLGAVGYVMGDYHVAADATTWLVQSSVGGNRGDVTRLRGARLVTTLEFRKHAKFDEALIKKVTGGDSITACAKYKDEITFKPTFALWLGANDRPKIRADDDGMWSRLRAVPFDHPVPAAEQDKHLGKRLMQPEHAQAILRWLVDGCRLWQEQGIGTCQAVEKASGAYRESQDPTREFFEEMITARADSFVTRKALWTTWTAWLRDLRGSDDGGARAVTREDLYLKARERFEAQDSKRAGERGLLGIQVANAA